MCNTDEKKGVFWMKVALSVQSQPEPGHCAVLTDTSQQNRLQKKQSRTLKHEIYSCWTKMEAIFRTGEWKVCFLFCCTMATTNSNVNQQNVKKWFLFFFFFFFLIFQSFQCRFSATQLHTVNHWTDIYIRQGIHQHQRYWSWTISIAKQVCLE